MPDPYTAATKRPNPGGTCQTLTRRPQNDQVQTERARPLHGGQKTTKSRRNVPDPYTAARKRPSPDGTCQTLTFWNKKRQGGPKSRRNVPDPYILKEKKRQGGPSPGGTCQTLTLWQAPHRDGSKRKKIEKKKNKQTKSLSLGPSPEMRPSAKADKSPGPRLSLNRSQWGGCSTKYDTPTEN